MIPHKCKYRVKGVIHFRDREWLHMRCEGCSSYRYVQRGWFEWAALTDPIEKAIFERKNR